MKSFETVYNELDNLLIKKLPEYIEKINKQHNDGVILKPYENKNLEENCLKTPYFSFKLEETEYEEKDRIIENTIYTVSLKNHLQSSCEKKIIFNFRYWEAIKEMFEELGINKPWQQIKIIGNESQIFLKIYI